MGKVNQRRAPKAKASRSGNDTADTTVASRQNPKASSAASKRNDVGRDAHHHHQPAYTSSSDPSIRSLLIFFVKVVLLTLISIPFWFLTGILSLLYGRPPKMVFPSQTWRYLCYTINGADLSFSSRIDLMMTIILHLATSPVSGLCWLLDEIIYGKQLNSLSIIKPLFVLSAYRSASTEMARALAKDTTRFVAPNAIMCAFPYLWLWKLVTWIVGDDNAGMTLDEMNGYLNKNFTKESLERHDNDHFSIDTFDGYFLSSHLNGLAFQLGPEVIVKEFNSAQFEEHNRYLFEHCFVEHVDRIARKALLFNGGVTTSPSEDRAFLLKGHFLSSASALQRKYPDARFLTVLRDPLDRLKSGINHMAVNATLWQGRLPRWDWLSEAFQQIEMTYCEREMEWYNNGSNRHVVKFDSFIRNFHKTMEGIYQDLLETHEDEIPAFPHPSKCLKRYTVNRSLKELGVDEAGLKRQLTNYYSWMKMQ